MEDYRGDFQKRYGHRDIVVSACLPHRAGAEWILGYFEWQVRGGTVFRPSETVQIGWMTVLLNSTDTGDLEVFEPEFGSVPIRWTRGADNTVRHLTIQKEVCQQIGAETVYPSIRQSAVVSPNFTKGDREFELSRDGADSNDSGWIFREGGYGGLSGDLCSLYRAASAVPAIIPFLALPSGSIVDWNGLDLQISANQSKISSVDNVFLKRLVKSAFFTREGLGSE